MSPSVSKFQDAGKTRTGKTRRGVEWGGRKGRRVKRDRLQLRSQYWVQLLPGRDLGDLGARGREGRSGWTAGWPCTVGLPLNTLKSMPALLARRYFLFAHSRISTGRFSWLPWPPNHSPLFDFVDKRAFRNILFSPPPPPSSVKRVIIKFVVKEKIVI